MTHPNIFLPVTHPKKTARPKKSFVLPEFDTEQVQEQVQEPIQEQVLEPSPAKTVRLYKNYPGGSSSTKSTKSTKPLAEGATQHPRQARQPSTPGKQDRANEDLLDWTSHQPAKKAPNVSINIRQTSSVQTQTRSFGPIWASPYIPSELTERPQLSDIEEIDLLLLRGKIKVEDISTQTILTGECF
jgi:hypothetical protein